MNKNAKGFSIEVIMTIGILFFLTSVRIISINLTKGLLHARNNQRRVQSEAIYGTTNQCFFGNNVFPNCVTTAWVDIISYNQLLQSYLFELPKYLICGSEVATGCHFKKNITTNECGIRAVCTERNEVITIGARPNG